MYYQCLQKLAGVRASQERGSRGAWRCAGRILYAERDSYLAPGIVVAAEALVRHETPFPSQKQRSTLEC